MKIFNVTYDITTADSAACGDVAERGFIAEYVSLRDAINLTFETRTSRVSGIESIECDDCPVRSPRWITVTNGMDYRTGAVERRYLHMPETLSSATRRRIYRLAKG